MKKLMRLIRISHTKEQTFGVLLTDWSKEAVPFAVTLERPWLDNRRSVSCIPTGIYACKRVQSPKFGNTFEVTGVTGRSHILFHKGNISDDTHGCILVGEQFDFINGKPAILASKKGFEEFLKLLEGQDEFIIDIMHEYVYEVSV